MQAQAYVYLERSALSHMFFHSFSYHAPQHTPCITEGKLHKFCMLSEQKTLHHVQSIYHQLIYDIQLPTDFIPRL